ncbi:MAG TPA: tol-pal system-associated acyl-CoA thioesterase [Azonexus sp.]|nr:tol-pal system-associated acyl-CoA thioesterase [Azonexus sp.]
MKYEPKPNAFTIPVRVYYEDTDAGGVVYYANYLKFFERCRTEWMRFAGHDQSALASEAGIGFVARKASVEYLKPARLDDELVVGLEVEKLTRVRVVFRQHVRRGDVELVTGTVEIACVNMSTMTPSAIPDFLHQKLEALK